MKRSILFLLTIGLFLQIIYAIPPQLYVDLGDFSVFSGEKIQDCRIGYRTIGTPNADSSNVILYPTWFGGTSEHIWRLINIHNFLDSTRYYIIVADALGNGVSTSPSNSIAQPGQVFPEIRIIDMARSAHALLEHLNIDHLHAIVGGSMGSMQGFEFIAEYPDMVNKAILYVSSPRESAYDLLKRQADLEIIALGRKYGIPEAEYMKPIRISQAVNGKTPSYFALEMSHTDVPEYLESFNSYTPGIFPADNYFCHSQAIHYHDISWRDKNDLDKTAERITADVFIIINKQDHMVSPHPALEFAKKIHAKILVLNNNRGHLGISYEIDKVRKAMARFLKN